MLNNIDRFLSAHAEIVMWVFIIALWILVIIFAKWANKFIKKRWLKQLKKDLQELEQEEQVKKATFRQRATNISKPESYEEFRARRLAEQEAQKEKANDQGGFIDLDVLAGLLRSWRV